jgi:Zn-dependent protease/CBS domain-containing protein
MKWSLSLGRIAGIRVQIHVTFLVLLAWIAISEWSRRQSVTAAVMGVLFILALFACVVLHEFGHALTAKRYGIVTRDITLLPIGGVARLERMPDKPSEELLVAIAGPLVNVVIATVLWAVLSVVGTLPDIEAVAAADAGITAQTFLPRLLAVNVLLVAFNLLPAFPMDGGRVLRALLAMRMDYAVATARAAQVGKLFATLFVVLGFFTNPFLIFIGLFVWLGATQESMAAQMKGALDGIPVSQAMLTDFRTLAPNAPLSHAVELLLAGSQQDFPVVDTRGVLGLLTRQTLLEALAKGGDSDAMSRTVDSVMQREISVADAREMLDAALVRLQSAPARTMPVVANGALVGLLTMENVGEFVSVHSALVKAR